MGWNSQPTAQVLFDRNWVPGGVADESRSQ